MKNKNDEKYVFMKDIIIQKNFLDEQSFIDLKNLFLNENLNGLYFFYCKEASGVNKPKLDNYQFYHTFYENNRPCSPYINILDPILDKIKPAALIRVKANCTPRTSKIIVHGMHVDTPYHNATSAVFYLNTNDGFTKFKNGIKIKSEQNKLVSFPSELEHSGSTHTSGDSLRMVINFVYFKSN